MANSLVKAQNVLFKISSFIKNSSNPAHAPPFYFKKPILFLLSVASSSQRIKVFTLHSSLEISFPRYYRRVA